MYIYIYYLLYLNTIYICIHIYIICMYEQPDLIVEETSRPQVRILGSGGRSLWQPRQAFTKKAVAHVYILHIHTYTYIYIYIYMYTSTHRI